jgi:tetratricopeptide (TPR) repeat protein
MSLIRLRKSLFLVAFISSVVLPSTAGNTALENESPPSEQTPDKQLSYTFAEVRIEFPSSSWELIGRSEAEKRISFARRYKIGSANHLGILLVDVFPATSREQHTKEYFNIERFRSRPQDMEWSGFVEGTMEIDGVHYPIMRYSISHKTYGSKTDGLFMILFPDDLEKRHRFYVLMLAESYPEGKPAPGFPDLEFIVKNLEILPGLVSRAGVFDDFDSGLPVGKDRYGIPIGFITFRDSESSVAIISTTSDHPELPGEEDNNQVLKLDLDVKAWAGVIHRFENAAVNTWAPRDWREFDGFTFWLYGNNTNTSLFVEILDNRKYRSVTPDAEVYTYTFTDNFSGWKLITVPFEELARKEIGNDAPNDGLGLSEVHGWAFGALNTGGSITYYIDDLEIQPVLAFSDWIGSGVTHLRNISTEALGAEYRSQYHAAGSHVESGDIEGALELLEPVVTYCEEKAESKDPRYLSFNNSSELDRYLSEFPDVEPLVWLDVVCAESFQLMGFIFAGAGEYSDALDWIDRSIALAPYKPAPHSEKGYVLHQIRRFNEALKEYEIAVQLSSEFPASRHAKPMALRGMGASLMELGRLDRAEKAFEESLALEPGNDIAKSALLYIDDLRSAE